MDRSWKSLQKTIRETKKDLEEAVSEGLNTVMKMKSKEKGVFYAVTENLAVLSPALMRRLAGVPRGTVNAWGNLKAKFQTLTGFLPAAYDIKREIK